MSILSGVILGLLCSHIARSALPPIDMINNSFVENPWIELGYIDLDDQIWVEVSTNTSTFEDAVVFISLPFTVDVNHSLPVTARVRDVRNNNGIISFETRLYQPNDSFCSKEWKIPTPVSPPLPIAWSVVEKGAYNISNEFFIIDSGNITRPSGDTTAVENRIRFQYPTGCGASSARCQFPSGSSVGAITQLQTVVNDRFLFARGLVVGLTFARYILVSHESTDPDYSIITDPETLAYMSYRPSVAISCVEGLGLETAVIAGVTDSPVYYTYHLSYFYEPGLFGMVLSLQGVNPVVLRFFSNTLTDVGMVIEEDQCADEETQHTSNEVAGVIIMGEVTGTDGLVECKVKINQVAPHLSTAPSSVPSPVPTTSIPTMLHPTSTPSALPTTLPSGDPTLLPSRCPSVAPSGLPLYAPSGKPSNFPTLTPSYSPSGTPLELPSALPTGTPTHAPSWIPSSLPSASPTALPLCIPSGQPSTVPSVFPTGIPTTSPSFIPSRYPTSRPSNQPTGSPSSSPSSVSTVMPSKTPTGYLADIPTLEPTVQPTGEPTSNPSISPTAIPSHSIIFPTQTPTALPSGLPTLYIPTLDEVALCDLSKQFSNPMRELYGWECDTKTGRPVIPICDRYEEGYEYYSYISSWTGITCNTEQYVTEISVSGFGFEGAIPSSLGYMPYLEYLDMSGNLFSGIIPQALVNNVTKLSFLDLSGNQLSGTFPHTYGASPSMKVLRLFANNLSGTIPLNLGDHMANMEYLYLDMNFLIGSIPFSFGSMHQLRDLVLNDNLLTGSIPSFLCELRHLSLFTAYNNLFSCIPDCFIDTPANRSKEVIVNTSTLCTEVPSAAPSLQSSALTLSPTAMSTLYSVADPEKRLEEAINGSIHEDDAFVIYETSNSALSYVAAQESWKEFVSNFLVTGLDFEYYFVEVWSVAVNYGAEDFISAHFSCDDVTVLQEVVSALVNENIYSGTCRDVTWSTSADGYLCIGCPLDDTVPFNVTHCVTSSNEVAVFAPDSTCQEDPDHLQLIASAINFFGRQVTSPTVPGINSVSVVAGRVSISVYVNVTLSAVSDGGTLYCAAFISSFTLTTPDEVKVSMTSVMHVLDSTANSDILEVELDIVDLVPLTNYSVYCVAEDSQSEFLDGTSLDDTLLTRTEVSTLCCRLVLIDAYPPAVILTRSLSTEQLVSSRNSFVFSYRLIRAPPPGSELVVTPVFTYYNSTSNSNVSLSGIRAFPASITFLSSYTGRYLYGSFTVTGEVLGLYYVGLNLSGTAAGMYEGEVGGFVLSTAYESPPIPQLELVRFDSTGRATVVFDNPSDYGVSVNPDIISKSFKCSILLSFVGSQLSECFWVNSSAIRISFSSSVSSSLLSSGDTVQLRNGVIRSYYCLILSDIICDDGDYSTNSFAVAAVHPSVSIPTVRMVVQNTVSVCSPIVLDVSGSTGNAGRSWHSFEFTVSVVSATPNAAQLSSRNIMQSFLNNLDAIDLSFPIHIDPSMHVAGSYRFGLTLYNFLRPTSGGYRFQTVTVSPSENDIFPPMVFISGRRFREVFASEPLTLYATASWNTSWLCDGYDFDGYELEYTWDLYRNFVYSGILSVSNDPKAFKADPYTLRPGATYQFYVTAVVKHPMLPFPLSSRAYATVYVKPGNVFAAIRGGQHRAVALGADVVLDASYSVDEGLTPSLLQQYGSDALTFSWKCIVYSPVELYGTSCDGYVANDSEFTLLSSALNSTYSYEVTVLVISSYVITPDVARSASASVVIEVRDESTAPAVEISSVFSKFNPNFKLEIDSTLAGSSYSVASWRVADSFTHSALIASNSFLTPVISNFTQGDLLGSGVSFPLSIAAASLTGGVTYTFVLTVNITGTDNYVYSTITLTANLPPTSGSLVVSPTNGTFNTTFSLRAPFWTDDVTDYPLLYSFSYYPYPGSNVVLSVKLKSEVPHTLSIISAGLDSYAYQVECIVDVEDFFGSNAIASTNITVTSDIFMNNDRYIYMLTNLKKSQGLAINTSNFDSFLQVIQHTATSLIAANCSGAPECAVLYRLPCSYKPHTCGPCVEGYISSSLGDSNVACKPIENNSERVDTTEVSHDYLQTECLQDDDCLFGVCDAGICVVPSKVCVSHIPNVVCSGHGSCLSSVNISQECLESDPFCGVTCVCDTGYGGSSCYYTIVELLVFDETMSAICEGLSDILQYNDISTFQFNTLTDALLQAFNPSYIISDTSTATCLNLLRNISAMITADYSLELSSSSVSNFFAIVSLSTELSVLSNESLYTIGSAYESGVSGLLRELSDGELPLDIVTENIKLSVSGDLLTSTSNKLYSPPSSSKDQFYGTPLPSLSFLDGGLLNCADYNKYARLLLSEWSMSAARYNSKLGSDIFQVGSAATSPILDDSSRINSTVEKYQVVLHYTEFQEWDPNKTIPGCTVYDSENNAYRDCPCSVSTFTPFNVTLECYDNNLFCQSNSSKNSRRLARHRNILTSASGYLRRHTQASLYWRKLSSRRLDFEYEGSEEEDYTSGARVASYGALVESVAKDLVDVSSSPEDIDWKASLPTLLGIVAALCMLSFGVFYFLRWDELDRLVLIYSKGHGGGSGAVCGAVSKASFAYDKGFIRDEKTESNDRVQLEPVTIKKSPMLRYDNDSADVLSKNTSQSTINSELPDLSHSGKDSSLRFSYEKISDFFESALPYAELTTHGFIVRMYNAIKDNHDWIRMFTFSSLRLSRTLRYLKLVMDLLLIFFVDTLFYGVLFPDDNTTCRQYTNTNSESCLEQDSYLVYGDKLCSWDEASQVCTIRPPPSDIIFYTVVTLLMTVVTVGPSLVYKYLLEEVCVCRPIMEDIGLSTDYWFPVGFNRAIAQASTADVLSNLDELEDRHIRFSALGEVLKQKYNNLKVNRNNANVNAYDDWTIQRLQFHDFTTVDEELEFIHQFVEEELWQELYSVPFPWRSHEAYMYQGTYDPVHYKSEVVLSLMGMYPDGTAAPLSLFQRLRYGNARRRLREKVKRSRRDARNIVKKLSFFDDRAEQVEKDTTLIQYFILEQFSAFERFALRRYFFHFDDLTPDSIGFWYWFGSWFFIILSGLFYVYWVVVWAATHGDVTSVAWTIQIVLFLIQDVFITQMIQIYLVCVLAMEIMRPQLKQINHVLNAVAATKIRSGISNNYRQISIVQHLSGACRAARSLHVSHLPAARLLMKVDDNDILMCRRIRNKKLNMLTAGLVGILTALAVTNVFLHDTFLNICIPTAWSLFLIAHALLERSVGYLYIIALYAIIIFVVFMHFCVIRPPKRLLQYRFGESDLRHKGLAKWNKSKKKSLEDIDGGCVSRAGKGLRLLFRRIISRIRGVVFDAFVCWKKMTVSRSKICNTAWGNMNRSVYQQGFVAREVEDIGSGEPEYLSFNRRGHIPESILLLRKSCTAPRQHMKQSEKPAKALELPVQCPILTDVDAAKEILIAKFRAVLNSGAGTYRHPHHCKSGALVLSEIDAGSIVGYVLNSLEMNGKMVTKDEYEGYFRHFHRFLQERGGYVDLQSLIAWFEEHSSAVQDQRRKAIGTFYSMMNEGDETCNSRKQTSLSRLQHEANWMLHARLSGINISQKDSRSTNQTQGGKKSMNI